MVLPPYVNSRGVNIDGPVAQWLARVPHMRAVDLTGASLGGLPEVRS